MGKTYNITYVIYKYDSYFAEGTKEELSEKTGLRAKYIDELSCGSKKLKKWQVLKLTRLENLFANVDTVNYDKIVSEMNEKNYKAKDIAELFNKCTVTIYQKLSKKNRFTYSEIEELEDLFFLEKGALLK